MRFIHTADWHIGKGYPEVEDVDDRAILRQQRIEAVRRVGNLAREHGADFILVAGDLFHSTTPDNRTIAAGLEAIGSIQIPVLAVPGNHDHAGPGSFWHQEFFQQELARLAPNFQVLLEAKPLELAGAMILPCPLVRKQEAGDVTSWLQSATLRETLPAKSPRIVLAHGSVHGFSSASGEEIASSQPNLIDLERLPASDFDYIALGDWHGTKEFPPHAWYAGTPELDRFMRGDEHDPGNVLLVEIQGRGTGLKVVSLRSSGVAWHRVNHHLAGESHLTELQARVEELLGRRVKQDLLHLTLTGHISLREDACLGEWMTSLQARLLRLKVGELPLVRPSDEEIQQLAQRDDNVIANIAKELCKELEGGNAEMARMALRELFLAVQQSSNGK